jgi:hypothetical protein
MNEKFIITVNSAIIYVIAFILTTIIHELLHSILGSIFGSNPVLHHNFVEHVSVEHLTVNQNISIALAGPLVSLVQGILSGVVYYRVQKKSQKLIHLFLLWFSVLGFFNFLGYLMTGPLFDNGDIGRVYLMANTLISVQILLAVAASILLVLIAYKMTLPYLKFCYRKDWVVDGKSRKNFSFHILFLPWIIGSVIITILYLPVIALVSIIYPIMSGMIFIFPWQNANRIEKVNLSTTNGIGKLSVMALGFLIILALTFKLILAPGINL